MSAAGEGRGSAGAPGGAPEPPAPRPILANILLFGRLLRQAGIPASLGQTLSFAEALGWIDIGDREQVFHAARSLLVNRREDLALFALLFDRFWRSGADLAAPARGRAAPPAPRFDPGRERALRGASFLGAKAGPSDPEVEVADRAGTYSRLEVLQRKEFSQMTPEELAAVRRLIEQMRWQISLRQTRRQIPDGRGARLHLRRVLRDAAKFDGTPFRLWRLRNKVKQRPVVLLADVSGSMEKYSRLVLQFFYSVSHSLRDVECFAFGTRLTRITGQLRIRNVDRALDEASREVVDWAGGTRIGDSLREFNRRWGRRVLRRGAIVIVVSDGWERGDPSALRREMRHLQHRCHRLLWLNPHLGHAGYRPLVEGIAAALPYVDDFLPVHNLEALEQLAERLGALPPGRRSAPGGREPGRRIIGRRAAPARPAQGGEGA